MSTKQLPGHVGVSELPVGLLVIIEQFVLTMELDISLYKFYWETCCMHRYPVASIQALYMKLENWDAATCSTLAQICTTLVYIKHSSH